MDDLTRCLYEFVCARRLGSLYADKEYEEYSHSIKLQQERILKRPDAERQRELSCLIDEMSFRESVKNEYLFQAALGLARELNALTR